MFNGGKPEPHWAIPQGQSAHDTFWDYVSLQPETLHNVMWAMSGSRHPPQMPHHGRLRYSHLPPD
ncbi:catalase [Escherichia coli]